MGVQAQIQGVSYLQNNLLYAFCIFHMLAITAVPLFRGCQRSSHVTIGHVHSFPRSPSRNMHICAAQLWVYLCKFPYTVRNGLLSWAVSVASDLRIQVCTTFSKCGCWDHGHLSTSLNIQCISQQPHHPSLVCGHGYVLACLELFVHPTIPASSWLVRSMSAFCGCMYSRY